MEEERRININIQYIVIKVNNKWGESKYRMGISAIVVNRTLWQSANNHEHLLLQSKWYVNENLTIIMIRNPECNTRIASESMKFEPPAVQLYFRIYRAGIMWCVRIEYLMSTRLVTKRTKVLDWHSTKPIYMQALERNGQNGDIH